MKKISRLRRILQSVAIQRHLTIRVDFTEEMKIEAQKYALKACQLVEKSNVPDIFGVPSTPKTREGAYLGQMVFHHWFNDDWRVALKYIDRELEQIEKGQRITVVDGEIEKASIDVKETDLTLPRTFLAWDPGEPWGLQVPQLQFRSKQYEAYVMVVILPFKEAKIFGDAMIFGYALKDEVAKTPPQRYRRHKILNRSIPYRKLHPMRFFKPGLWNSEEARQTTLSDEI